MIAQDTDKFMIQLGRFDQLGSGVTNINKSLPLYAKGAKPVFEETRHGFELTIPLAEETSAPEVAPEVTPEVKRMLGVMTGEMSRTEIQHNWSVR